ncbi:zinc finger protein [Saccharomonospora saliphila]|uniref:zinc finger protein n=1 Tax=Saccharomonospora saliphila TaxID=369829 RepID=UPI0009FD9644|nr:zinc finger protein [Saccharomonospora saliphila]
MRSARLRGARRADGAARACPRRASAGRVPGPHRPFPAVCGATVTPTESDFAMTGWPTTTCWDCDHEIRVRESFPRDEIAPLPNTPTRRSPDDGTSRSARPPRPRTRRT